MAGNKKYFADRTLKALPAAKSGTRYEVWDTKLPGFWRPRDEREVDKHRPGKAGRISFIYYTRYPGSPSPTRRVLGLYGAITLLSRRGRRPPIGWI